MVIYLPRSAWGARPARGANSLVPSEVENTAFHWPGMSKAIDATGDIGKRRIASALRSWQTYHMDVKKWSDIAYQIAIDQAGRVWTLRGINVRSGANGDGTVNRKYGAILLILGPGEKPSAAMVASARAVVADYRKRYARMPVKPTTHSAVRPAGTDCPGSVARGMINSGLFNALATAPRPPLEDDDMALTGDDLDKVEARAFKANSDYAIAFWIAPTGTGTAIRNLLREMKLQLDRIEDDTDGLATSRQLVADLDANVERLAAQATDVQDEPR